MIAMAGGLWTYLHLLAFLKERGIRLGRYEGGNSNPLSRNVPWDYIWRNFVAARGDRW